MNIYQKISLLSLLGLIIPFGNVWGPALVRIRDNYQLYSYRKRLIIFELLVTLITYAIAISLIVKSISANYNPGYITIAAYVLLIQIIIILITAVFVYTKRNGTENM